jgi:excisionase family DNA binding protein
VEITSGRVYTAAEAAKCLRTDRGRIYAFIRTGELPAFRLDCDARKNLIHGADLLRLVERLKAGDTT